MNRPRNLAHTLGIVGDRWTLQIVAGLLDGPKRFGELADALTDAQTGIAPNVLTSRLRQLERDRLVVAMPYSQRPMRLSYALTDSGRELADAIALLSAWGAHQTGDTGDTGDMNSPIHEPCGTALETRLYCPTCERAADEPHGDLVAWM